MTTITTKYPFVGCIDTKQGGRNENQDNAGFVDTPLGLLLVVCDGMGGGPGGRTASLMAVDSILNVLIDVSDKTPRKKALKFAIEKANDIIYAKAKEFPELQGMGTTVAAILINEDSAVIAHAGDTRIYQLRKGSIAFRSSDHSLVANLVRQKKITEEEARNDPRSNRITRALGIRPSMEIEFDEVPFLRGDRFVVCTDGIWGMLPQPDLIKSLSQAMGICELTSLMTEEIDRIGRENGGGHDNLTLAVVDVTFDSVRKKVKHQINVSNDYKKKNERNSHKLIQKLLLLMVCAVSVIVLLFFLIQVRQGKSEEQKLPLKEARSESITTIDKAVVRINEDDQACQESVLFDQQDSTASKDQTLNPFQNSTLKEGNNKELSRQINHVVKNLDCLKEIRGKNRDEAKRKKRKYVQGVIKPNVNRLRNEVVIEKKKDVEKIVMMLNDSKTISSSKFGQPTKESIIHIEKIKSKVKVLQD